MDIWRIYSRPYYSIKITFKEGSIYTTECFDVLSIYFSQTYCIFGRFHIISHFLGFTK
ncbi:hypothetical protein BDA99DRAFT_144397 [Phascolomyces articulosus]|uniref:Uncharacterized protein n=1 Tax=Phascolomyces articulosus TaxID=60185 RepID=A0AAD5K947_9FUNG|nr:hypothetical protein BDA99DRAFT_144397 [Phascolomyces articulosus]